MLKTAFSFIKYDKPKSIGALAGIIISVFLIGQQAGVFIFLTDAMKSIVANNQGYIWVTAKLRRCRVWSASIRL
jgi:putative ABC transport system permease protein